MIRHLSLCSSLSHAQPCSRQLSVQVVVWSGSQVLVAREKTEGSAEVRGASNAGLVAAELGRGICSCTLWLGCWLLFALWRTLAMCTITLINYT